MVTLTPEIKQQLEESDGRIRVADQGVLLIRIVPGSPAAEAGLQTSDVIQSIITSLLTKQRKFSGT